MVGSPLWLPTFFTSYIMKKFLIGIFCIFLAFLFFHDPEQDVMMAPHVSHHIEEVSVNYPNETLACLDYFQIFEDIYIYHYTMPHTMAADGTRIAAVACRKDQISFHNHPAFSTPEHVKNYIERETGERYNNTTQHVFLSKIDIMNNVKQGHPFVIVASDGFYAWWSEQQIERAWEDSVNLLQPIPTQKNF